MCGNCACLLKIYLNKSNISTSNYLKEVIISNKVIAFILGYKLILESSDEVSNGQSSSINNVRSMKLITHNMLTSMALKNVKEGFPLKIYADEVKTVEVDFQPEFIAKTVNKLNWKALLFGAKCVNSVGKLYMIGHEDDLPQTLPPSFEDDEALLKKLHHILLEVEVVTGNLECPESKRKFPISNGIPNMLLNEDEV